MKGFILLGTLGFLLLIAALCFIAFNQENMKLQMHRQRLHYYEALLAANHTLNHLSLRLAAELKRCKVSRQSQRQITRKPLYFWQNFACSGENQLIQYYYVIEALQFDSCASSENYSTEYFRMTILVFLKKMSNAHLMLQRSIALKSKLPVFCKSKVHNVSPGRQSQQQLIWMG